MNCSRCSQLIDTGATFCGNCGQPVQAPASAEAADVASAQPVSGATSPLPGAPVGDDAIHIGPPVPPASPISGVLDNSSPQTSTAIPLTPAANGASGMPSYAIANPVQQKGETKAMVGLVLAILGVPGSLVPLLGLGLGVTGLVIGTSTRSDNRKTVSTLTIVFAVIAILGSIGMFVYSYNALMKQRTAQGSTSSSQTASGNSDSNGGSTSAAAKGAGTVRTADTPCFTASLPNLATFDSATGSCSLKTYNTASTTDATNIYTIDMITQKSVTAANFIPTAKDTLTQSLKSNLPGLVVSAEKETVFAGSPAYLVEGKYEGNVGVQMLFILHPVSHGENITVIVHALNDGAADAKSLEKNWVWK